MFGRKPGSNRKTMDASLSPLRESRKRKGKYGVVGELCRQWKKKKIGVDGKLYKGSF